MINKIISFDTELKNEVLDIFNKAVDSKGYIVEKKDPTQRTLTKEGDEIQVKNFAGLTKGSLVFVEKNIVSLSKLADKLL